MCRGLSDLFTRLFPAPALWEKENLEEIQHEENDWKIGKRSCYEKRVKELDGFSSENREDVTEMERTVRSPFACFILIIVIISIKILTNVLPCLVTDSLCWMLQCQADGLRVLSLFWRILLPMLSLLICREIWWWERWADVHGHVGCGSVELLQVCLPDGFQMGSQNICWIFPPTMVGP